jgi:hypothetical protein
MELDSMTEEAIKILEEWEKQIASRVVVIQEPSSPRKRKKKRAKTTAKSFLTSFQKGMTPEQRYDFLKSWLLEHSHDPYPTLNEKNKLMYVTGMSLIQLNNWMSNGRRRILKN